MTKTEVNLIKNPHQQENWSEEQLLEFVACADPITGYQHFLNNFFVIQHPVKGRMAYKSYEYQERLASVYHNHRYSIAMLPRQSGKCVGRETIINIRNKTTGISYDIPIGIFHEYQSALNKGEIPPDISQYAITIDI